VGHLARQPDVDLRQIGRLSISYMITVISEVLRTRPVDFMDLLIVSAIFNANGEARRGVSRNAISRALNVPLETVRRRVIGLLERKALVEQHDGLVFAYDNDIGLGNNAALDELNLKLLRQLFQELKARGLDFD
jgi:hypothetical protein